MKLNEAINLVVPVGERQAYHTPISREVFEANYRILAATKAALSGKGVMYQMDAGPRIAALAMRDEGKRDAEDRGSVDDAGHPRDEMTPALLAEIKRLTVILCPSEKGFDLMPVDSAIQGGQIDADDWREAESAIVFFTCLYCLSAKANRQAVATATASLLKGAITSLPPSGFVDSLPRSTPEKTSTAEAFVVPS